MSAHEPPELLVQARDVLRAMRLGARRAFVLELTGTPKAGKTSVLTTLQAFFKEAGFRVSILKERATECPLAMKGHFFFNAWTMSTMLAEVLASLETDADLLLLDRGFLDALIWLELQSARQQVSDDEKATFTDFVLLPRWRGLIDYTIIMKADPAINLMTTGPNPRRMYAYEAADPVEGKTFPVRGIPMSDFVYPAYFEAFRKPRSTRFDHLGRIRKPFEILPDGYQIVFEKGRWSEKYGSKTKQKAFAKEDRRGHRSETRKSGRLRRAVSP